MVQLRSCYFCGTTDALSEYETLPERVDGGEASRQVVLCDRCHAKLTNVLAPIVDRLGRGSDGAAPSGPTPAGELSTGSTETPAPTPDDRPTQTDVTFGGVSASDDAGDAPSSAGPTSSTSGVDGANEGGDGSDTSETDDVADAADAADANEPAAGDDPVDDDLAAVEPDTTEDAHGATEDARDATEDAHDATDETTDDDPDAATTGPGDAATSRADLDRVYHKLLRFLRNREFPIPRTEAERIAQSAYDLTAPEASEVIQRAVDRDVLAERDGELHRN